MVAEKMTLSFMEPKIKPHQNKPPRTQLPRQVDCLVTAVAPLVNYSGLLAEPRADFAADVPEAVRFCRPLVLRPALACEAPADFFSVVVPPGSVAGVEGFCPGGDSPGVVDCKDGPLAGELKVNCAGAGPAGDDDDGSLIVSPGKGLATFSVMHPAFFSFSADSGVAGAQFGAPGFTISPPTSLKADSTTHSWAAITGCTGGHPVRKCR